MATFPSFGARRSAPLLKIYTDSRARLLNVLGVRDGAQLSAIDEMLGWKEHRGGMERLAHVSSIGFGG